MTIAERKSLFIVLPTFYPRWPEKPATSTPVLLASGFSVWTMLLGCEAERLVLTKLENTEVSKAWKYKVSCRPSDESTGQYSKPQPSAAESRQQKTFASSLNKPSRQEPLSREYSLFHRAYS